MHDACFERFYIVTGLKSVLTLTSHAMLELCLQRLAEVKLYIHKN